MKPKGKRSPCTAFTEQVMSLGTAFLEVALRTYVGLVFVFLYLPVIIIVIYSFNDSDLVLIWQGVTTRWYGEALDNITFRTGLRVSIIVACLSAAISVVLGTLLGIGLERSPRWVQLSLGAVMILSLITPEVLVGISALLFFTSIKVKLGILTVVAAHVVFGTSIVGLLVRARIAGVGKSFEEASADLGASAWMTLSRITIPLMTPAIFAGGLLAFTLSFDNFVISFFTTGPGAQTLPLAIWGQIRFGVSPIANAIASVIILFSIAMIALTVVAYQWRARRLGTGGRIVQ